MFFIFYFLFFIFCFAADAILPPQSRNVSSILQSSRETQLVGRETAFAGSENRLLIDSIVHFAVSLHPSSLSPLLSCHVYYTQYSLCFVPWPDCRFDSCCSAALSAWPGGLSVMQKKRKKRREINEH